jgi:phage gp29-like protein
MGLINLFRRKKRKGPIKRELAAAQAALEYMWANYNPDDLVTRKGLEIYDEMMKDAQVKACISAKINARLASGWEVQPASLGKKDIAIRDFVEQQLLQMEGSFDDDLADILEAIAKGYSITEINYYLIPKGRWRGKYGLKSLKAKDPRNFNFDLDEYLNIKNLINYVQGEERKLDPEKFIVFSYNKKHERPWGQSDLRAAYRDWWTKDYCYRQRNISAQRLAQPVVIGVYDDTVSDSEQEKLETMVRNIQNQTQMILPRNAEIVIKEARDSGSEEFQRIIDNCNLEITKAILGATLIIEESKRYGSYATAKVHLEMLMQYLNRLGLQVEAVINDQLIRRLVDYNFNVERYPRWRFRPYQPSNLEQVCKMILQLVDKGIVSKDEEWIRERLDIPKKKE